MRDRFERFKTRRGIQTAIKESAERARGMRSDIEKIKQDLAAAQANPSTDPLTLRLLENSLAGMERILSDFKVNHERFRDGQARPSPAFPSGIASCQEPA